MSVEQIEDNTHRTITNGAPTRAIQPLLPQGRDLHLLCHQRLQGEDWESHLIPKGEELDALGVGQMNAWLAYVWSDQRCCRTNGCTQVTDRGCCERGNMQDHHGGRGVQGVRPWWF